MTSAYGFAYVERALREGIGRRAFRAKEIALVAAFFGEPLRCVYCDSPEVGRWDHLVPVVSGGETVVGNMVPACAPCDDSKSKRHFATWLRLQAQRGAMSPESAEERITRLREYMERFEYQPEEYGSRLSADRAVQLADLRSRLSTLRRDVEEFIAQVRKT